MRLTILSLIARLFGIQFRVDGVRYGANAVRPVVPPVTIRSPRSATTGSDNMFIGYDVTASGDSALVTTGYTAFKAGPNQFPSF